MTAIRMPAPGVPAGTSVPLSRHEVGDDVYCITRRPCGHLVVEVIGEAGTEPREVGWFALAPAEPAPTPPHHSS